MSRPVLSDEDLETIYLRMLAETDSAIARDYGVSRQAIHHWRTKWGLPRYQRPKPAPKPKRIPLKQIHGTRNCYDTGCRCDGCKEANTREGYAAKKKMFERGQANPKLIPHGTPGGYLNWGCRCDDCTLAQVNKCSRYRQYGTSVIR